MGSGNRKDNLRFFAPDYDRAPITLRVVSLNEATRRLVLNFQQAWMQNRQDELEAGMKMERSS